MNIVFTKDKKYYTDRNDQINSDYFFLEDLDECTKFVAVYKPEMILIDRTVDNETLVEYIAKIKNIYSYSPVAIFAQKDRIIEIIETNIQDSTLRVKINKIIEIPIEIEKKLDYALAELKFSPKLKGYNYIKRCIFEGICNATIFDNMEKCLYNQVADIYNTSIYSIERCINFSIRSAYLENPPAFDKYNTPPSNGKFLKTLLIYIKY